MGLKGRPSSRREYAWPEAQVELERGVHPEVVAARMGTHVDDLLQVANDQGWPVSWKPHASPIEMLDDHARRLGLSS